MRKEATPVYIGEQFPKKTYTRKKRIFMRERGPYEIFMGEVFIALFIILMMLMLVINYQSNLAYNYQHMEETEKEIDVGIDIVKGKKLSDAVLPAQDLSGFAKLPWPYL